MIRHIDLNLFLMVVVVGLAMSNLYIYCRFGKEATDYYLRYGDEIYKLQWIDMLDENLKKIVLLIIQNAQRPLNYHGFNCIYLNLETFAKVRKQISISGGRKSFPYLFAVIKNCYQLLHDVQGRHQC